MDKVFFRVAVLMLGFGIFLVCSNRVQAQVEPVVPPPSTSIKVPPSEPYIAISPDYFYTLEEILYIEGRSEPNAVVTVILEKQGEQPIKFSVKADSLGEWVIAEKTYLSQGNWQVRARQLVGTLVSGESNPRVIRSVVTGVDIFGLRIRYVVIGGIAVLFFAVLAFVFAYYRRKIRRLQRSMMQKQLSDAEQKIHHGFSEIRKDLMDQLRDLAANAEGRTLTPDEVDKRDRILRELEELEKNLDHDLSNISRRY